MKGSVNPSNDVLTTPIFIFQVIGLSVLSNLVIPDHDAGVFLWTRSPAINATTNGDKVKLGVATFVKVCHDRQGEANFT